LPYSPPVSEISVIRSNISIGGSGNWALPGPNISPHVDGASKLAARLDTADTTDQLVRITLILHDVKAGKWGDALNRLKSVETVGTAKSITPIISALAPRRRRRRQGGADQPRPAAEGCAAGCAGVDPEGAAARLSRRPRRCRQGL
jgi:hypothetical protein